MTTATPAAAPVHILGMSGSLRRASYNSALLRAAAELLPASATLSTIDLAPLPMFNQDLITDRFPEVVEAMRQRMAQADALLVVTPEYNFSIPAVLKNAIDWASRAPNPPLTDKPAAIMGASMGMLGTARSQMHLRQVFVFLNVHVINKPEVLIGRAQDRFDAEGRLVDEPTRKLVREQLEALVTWTRRLQGR